MINKLIEEYLIKNGIENITISKSNRPDLCDYQSNDVFKISKMLGKNPIEVGEEIVSKINALEDFSLYFKSVEFVKPGFINIVISDSFINREIKNMNDNYKFNIKMPENSESFVVDYCGANVAKPLHVGHMRTTIVGESIARIANVLGDGKPIIQSLKDLKSGRRSEWHRLNKGFIEPTLKDCVAGDLALVMPHRIITNILEGLETLDKIIPGINNDDTLLYGPEIKFFSNEIETDNNFKLKKDNIYFIGDGAGKAGNIVTAAATGLVAARDIIKKSKNS